MRAVIGGPGDVVHSLVERRGSAGDFLPEFDGVRIGEEDSSPLFRSIDHVALSVDRGTLDRWAGFYRDCLGFEVVHERETVTEYSGMRSVVAQSGEIRFPLLEPADGRRKSQIEEYLHFHGGPGAQHVALLSDDVAHAVRQLRAGGIEFLRPPAIYYELLPGRLGVVDEDLAVLEELGILVDRDEWGHLLQTFTRPLQCRPTLFFEVIQRKKARGFGAGNIRALFEAVETEQARRGNL